MGIGDILKGKINGRKEPDSDRLRELVSKYAKAYWDEKDAAKVKDAVKKEILEFAEAHDIGVLSGDEGVVSVYEQKNSIGIIGKKAEKFLTEAQLEECTGVTRKGFVSLKFKPVVSRIDK